MLQHIAITVKDSKEIENFYEDVMIFSMKHKFSVNEKITQQIFKTEESVDAYVMCHDVTQLEIFLSPKKERKVLLHICLAYWKAEITYKKALELGYKALVKKNPVNDTYIVWDKSGNMFEIKKIQDQ